MIKIRNPFKKNNRVSQSSLPPAVPNPYAFEDLAPVSDADQVEVYLKSLNWALSGNRIKNIAITGPYGSGKSSMLQTFQKQYTAYHYLNISLASFKEASSESNGQGGSNGSIDNNESLSNEAHRLIELSVLQQMFYQVADDKIPDSRFKRINHLTKEEINRITAFVVLGILGVVLLLFPGFFEQLENWKSAIHRFRWLTMLTGIALLLPGTIASIKYLIRFFNSSGFKKLNITSGEIEINPKSETSILNKYFDEIVYFFEVNDYNVVIFEDLDRFNDPEIFTKLRELNTLLNSSNQLNRHVVFVYAIKDDMFPDDKTRTKFFEFIIPVIPVVNWFNSLEILTRKMTNPALELNVSERFLGDIMLYIDDMRVLKNIFNEFIIYKENLKNRLKQDKLLAIIIYKNIFPEDFAALHRNQGLVYDVFNKKKELISELLQHKRNEKDLYLENITRIENLSLKELAELRSVYILKLSEQNPDLVTFELDGARRKLHDLLESELFDKLRQATTISYEYFERRYSTMYSKSVTFNFAEFEKVVDETQTYAQRVNDINRRQNGYIDETNTKVKALEQQIQKLQSQSLKDILITEKDAVTKLPAEFTQKKLLLYLVREGYIDEMYPSFISYFYEGSMTRTDMDFVISIKDQEYLGYDYKLEKVPGVLKMLKDDEVSRDAAFNTDLFVFLFQKKASYQNAYKAITKRLSDQSVTSTDFFDKLILLQDYQWVIFKEIDQWWPDCWYDYTKRTHVSYQQKSDFLALIIRYGNLDGLAKLNKENSLAAFIENDKDFLSLLPGKELKQRLKKVIEKLSIKFNELVVDDQTLELFKVVYAGDHYVLNFQNVKLILSKLSENDETDLDKLNTAFYTTILGSRHQDLIDYINADLESFVKDVALTLPDNREESIPVILDLLNHEFISPETKDALLDKQIAIIGRITDVKVKDLWDTVFCYNSIEANWYNVSQFYEHHKELNQTLIDWLNEDDHADILGKVTFKTTSELTDAMVSGLSAQILKNNEIKDDRYNLLVPGIWYWKYPDLDVSGLSDIKVKRLISLDKLKVTPANYNRLKEHYADYTGLLARDIDAFFNAPAEYALDQKGYGALLDQNSLTPEQRLRLIDQIAKDETGINIILAGKIIRLLNAAPAQELSADFLKSLIAAGLDSAAKASLYNLYKSKIGLNDLGQVLKNIKGGYEQLAGNGRPKFILSDLNRSIIGFLDNVDFISSKEINEEKQYIRANTKRK